MAPPRSEETGEPAAFGRFRSWPITYASTLEPEIKAMGINVPASVIDGTGSPSCDSRSLSAALVSVGPAGRGGTGSFVSDDGLIITNWHVAYEAVRQASLAASKDYIDTGFVATDRVDELEGPSYEVRITRSCVDVSDRVLAVIQGEPDPLKRSDAVRDCLLNIAAEAEQKLQSEESTGRGLLRCDVQEMMPNESYVLFTFERLLDVRIVYVPPKALGNFGGDTDNFEWPRHTADFTLLRAYVAPDGSGASYSQSNVPYRPASRLSVNPAGLAPGDAVMLLGFPGHTMRYAPSSRLAYADSVAIPADVAEFSQKLELINRYEGDSEEARLKMGGGKKGLANEFKRSSGKRVMMRKLDLIVQRKAEEAALCAAAPDQAPAILSRLAEIYDTFRENSGQQAAFEALAGTYHGSALLSAGHILHESAIERQKPDTEREQRYRDRNLPFLAKRLAKRISDIHMPHEAALISIAVGLAQKEGLGKGCDVLGSLLDGSRLPVPSKLRDLKSPEAVEEALSNIVADDVDPFVKVAAAVYPDYRQHVDTRKALQAERDALFEKLLSLQRLHLPEAFFPDANGTLRFSVGHVEGYTAADAVEHTPVTTLGGLFDKALEFNCSVAHSEDGVVTAGENEFECPPRLATLLAASSDAGVTARATPVNLLYSTDTVGGNSGSPVLDGQGNFCAINFDRQRQGLLNEYKWSRKFSRSIGVDVRFILWLVGEYDGAKILVDEMLNSNGGAK